MAPRRSPPWVARRWSNATAACRYPSRVVAYRCRVCGNRTRFDVVTTSTTNEFHHFTLGGELRAEEAEVTASRVESVTCRWCGRAEDVEALDESAAPMTP